MAEATLTPEENAATAADNSGWRLLLERIAAWPIGRKLALAGVTLLTLVFFGLIVFQARTADYQLLFANLDEADAASVVAWLKEHGVPYRIKGGGHAIWVPADRVHETRLDLAASGLPQAGGTGFEIFDKQSFALTDFVQKVNYTRALQGELARTIAALEPVAKARVHLALPERRLFKEQQKPPTVSVVLTLRPGQQLNKGQIQGIVHLVSGSIQGLRPENVTIVDQDGKVLSELPDSGIFGDLSPDMVEFQLGVERRLEDRAQSLLDKAVGPGNGMARVTAELDFSSKQQTEEIFDPEEPVIRSEQVVEEKHGSELAGGVPGVQSNLQGNTRRAVGATAPSSRSERTTNYEISRTVNKTVFPVGTIKRLSVAVLVADRVETVAAEGEDKKGGGQPATKVVPRTPEELQRIEKLVAGALGLDPKRGDTIEVVSMPFTEPVHPVAGMTANVLYEYLPLIRYGALFLAGLMLYLLLVRPLLKTLRQEAAPEEVPETAETLSAEAGAETAEGVEIEEEVEIDPITRLRQDVETNPIFIAHIVKNWINEEG